ncbi:hypothetical protein [Chryseobacterium sp. P1-3]|uniref:hypothetical protein n=1 Tax=Chryseobacterium sp. (strain P1-3) TaxID=1517683 RepID=UPI000A57294A|nr:hypothetical protein [Chryseobacterium sp. P1-3]
MDTNIDFKNIWKQQTSHQPSIEELLGKLKQFRLENLRKLILINIMLIITSLGIAFIWYRYQPQLVTTKIGIVLVILAMLIFLCAYNRLFMVFYKIDNTQTNQEYLQSLYIVKGKQKIYADYHAEYIFYDTVSGIMLLYVRIHFENVSYTGHYCLHCRLILDRFQLVLYKAENNQEATG